jgi:hypothetical protein
MSMLDSNHPQTNHVFAAARLEAEILDSARRIIAASQPSDRAARLKKCEETLDRMYKLNNEQFHSSPSIASIIHELQIALSTLAASTSPTMDMIEPALAKLESDDGFGTWAI